MKKVEIATIAILIVAFGLYLVPNLFTPDVKKQEGLIKANCASMASKIGSQLRASSKDKPSIIVEKSVTELNKHSKNPVKRSKSAYYVNESCAGCIKVSADDKTKIYVITGYDANLKPIITTTIKPPSSFVTFQK